MSEQERSRDNATARNGQHNRRIRPTEHVPSWMRRMDAWKAARSQEGPSVVFTEDVVTRLQTPKRRYDPDRERED